MNLCKVLSLIHKELKAVGDRVDEKPVEKLLDVILSVEKVYVAAQGRSGLMARAFAMRLMHLGLTSFVAGETVTPAFLKNDLMIAVSGSGETHITLHLAESSKESGGQLAVITANPDSSLGRMADILVVLPCNELVGGKRNVPSVQLGRALFEQASLILLDAMVFRLAEKLGRQPHDVLKRHTNLE